MRQKRSSGGPLGPLLLLSHCSEEHSSHRCVGNSGPPADDGRHTAQSPVSQPAVKTTKRVLTLEYKIGLTFKKQSMFFTVFTNQKSKTIPSTQ